MRKAALRVFSASLAMAYPTMWAAEPPVAADTYTSSTSPASNFGALTNLLVNSTSNSYVKFDLSAYASRTGADVANAYIAGYVKTVNTAGTINICPVTGGAWTESGLTANNAPAATCGGLTFTAAAAPAGVNQWLVGNVTSLVQAWLTAQGTNFGVALTSGGADVVFDSKEATTSSHEFELIVMWNGAGGASGATGPTGLTGATGASGGPGADGATGASGVGAVGATGASGVGTAGATGASGVATAGEAGAPGVGTAGATGAPGVGTAGATGASGVATAGATGASGIGINGTDGATGATGAAGSQFIGVFSGGTTYAAGDVVSFNGASYISTAGGNIGNTPPASPRAPLAPAG